MSKVLARARAADLVEWMNTRLSNIPLDTKGLERERIAQGLFDVTLEHHGAIVYLHDSQLLATMFAIARPTQESLVRGLWIRYGASDADLARFKRGKIPNYAEIIESVEEAMDSDGPGILMRMKKATYGIFSDFTHGGFEQVTRRFDAQGNLLASYPESEIIQIFESTGALALIAGTELATMNSEKLAVEFIQKMMEFSSTKVPW